MKRYIAQKSGEILNTFAQSRDCGSAGQAAPAEDIAKRLSASEIVAEKLGSTSNPQGSQARPRAVRFGRPIGDMREAHRREICRVAEGEGFEPPGP